MANIDNWLKNSDSESEEDTELFLDALLFDVHTHFVEDPDLRKKGRKKRVEQKTHSCSHSFLPTSEMDFAKCAKQLSNIKIQNFCLMGTEPWNWGDIKTLHEQHDSRIIPAFGIHPWRSHLYSTKDSNSNSTTTSSWQDDLLKLLETIPRAIVGEVGLDKAAKAPETGICEYEKQKEVFFHQFQVAVMMNRPISIHCVRAFGDMYDYLKLQTQLPPKIMMHSFCKQFEFSNLLTVTAGAPDMVVSLIKLPKLKKIIYFSFSYVINARTIDKLVKAIQAVPDDRILIETDQNSLDFMDSDIIEILKIVSKAKGWAIEETASKTYANALDFFSDT